MDENPYASPRVEDAAPEPAGKAEARRGCFTILLALVCMATAAFFLIGLFGEGLSGVTNVHPSEPARWIKIVAVFTFFAGTIIGFGCVAVGLLSCCKKRCWIGLALIALAILAFALVGI